MSAKAMTAPSNKAPEVNVSQRRQKQWVIIASMGSSDAVWSLANGSRSIGLDNGLPPVRCQAVTPKNFAVLPIWPAVKYESRYAHFLPKERI